mmetsp:Transcript_9656/g.29310  ORF Transcript_9656/g.29310 Transcript_9656/m.29310 type:complete len:235 (+) Transcript_9656:120-824(+)
METATTTHEVIGSKRARESLGEGASDVLGQGAEGIVRLVEFLGRRAVMKQRFKKEYRHPVLDRSLTSKRLSQEVRTMLRCRKLGVPTPAVYFVDTEAASIYMEYLVHANTLKVTFSSSPPDMDDICRKVGTTVAKLHDGNIVHGDLTTSNMMLHSDGRLFLIDFGLSYFSAAEEDKAVDLYVLERAISSTHSLTADRMNNMICSTYLKASRCGKNVLRRLEDVRQRGRKRVMVG